MTDPLDSLRDPGTPVDPDPAFAARLRDRLVRAVLDPLGGTMETAAVSRTVPTAEPTLAPYIVVPDGRAALDWYRDVFGATARGEMYVMPDGSIGHAELAIGGSVLMLAEGGVPTVAPPVPGQPASVTLHLRVHDVDAVLDAARRRGARMEREPADQPYGRTAVLVDPFGHRWMLNGPVPAPGH